MNCCVCGRTGPAIPEVTDMYPVDIGYKTLMAYVCKPCQNNEVPK